ncbi:MAG: hypothetical protein HY865_22080 [Chloroflexi bacterium]|nr:hypothetical protein [Chloroflexota bacterium]
MARGLTKERELEIEKRRAIVAANVLAGLNYRDMASQLGVSLGTIANDVKIVARRYREEQISEYADIVQLELRRIDTALNGIWDGVKAGDKNAIFTMVMLQNQRAKYLALFDPELDRLGLLFPNLNNDPEKQVSIEEIRRKRWEQVYPQLKDVIDLEAQDVTGTSQLPDQPADADSGSSEPNGGVSADSSG